MTLVAGLPGLWACGVRSRGLRVLAASSLVDVLQAIAADWVALGQPEPLLSFGGTSRLAQQLQAGAPADLFLSADQAWMDHLVARGLVDPDSEVDLVGNRLVLIVPATAPSDASIQRLALAGDAVPAGRYARQALAATARWPAVQAQVVEATDVRAVLSWVARGEADAGVVYASDAHGRHDVRVVEVLPADSHDPIVYPAAVTRTATDPALAAAFLDHCRRPRAAAHFAAAGFAALEAAQPGATQPGATQP